METTRRPRGRGHCDIGPGRTHVRFNRNANLGGAGYRMHMYVQAGAGGSVVLNKSANSECNTAAFVVPLTASMLA